MEMTELKITVFSIITADRTSFLYTILMKVQAVVLCYKFLYACIVEICRQSTEHVFNRLLTN
jgi:hypothetical protein